MLKKMTLREIRNSLGRYLAILAIVALGVGFFSGLKVTREAMVSTTDTYLKTQNFYDFKVMSTLGYEKSDAKALAKKDYIQFAESVFSSDALCTIGKSQEKPLIFYSLTENVNKLDLVCGRLPEKANECVVDSGFGGEELIGKKVKICKENSKDTKEKFKYKEYVITGTALSPLYLNFERGSTSLGGGTLSGFAIIPYKGFDVDYYSEIYITLDEKYPIYSCEYDDLIDAQTDVVKADAKKRAKHRYNKIVDEATEKLNDAKEEYADGLAEYESERADALAELADAKEKIDDGKATIKDTRKDLDKKEKELLSNQKDVEDGLDQVATQRAEFEAMKDFLPPEQAAVTQATLDGTEKQLKESLPKIKDGLKQIKDGRKELDKKEKELDDAYDEYLDARQEAFDEFAKAEAELEDAKEKIADAEEEIADIEKPKTYILDRNTNIGYACFENDSKIVDGIAKVFPIFFFLVAALVCMTTMTRMIDEQRTQIGVLKAMGYSGAKVAGKYIFYSGSAALIGCLIGFFGGCYLFPKVIWFAYGMMYDFNSEIEYVINVPLAVISVIVSLICTIGATLFSCYKELREVPAQLIRPKSPKNGKRILLERIPFIWNHIGFLYKVSFRNVFRYKKRFIMMIIGISGCTALLLTGFGLNDSIKNIVDFQYDEIQKFDYSITFDKNMKEKKQIKFAKDIDLDGEILYLLDNTYDLVMDKNVKSVNLICPSEKDLAKFEEFVDLHDFTGAPVEYPKDGEIVICRKLSKQYGVEIGDEILIRDNDMNEFSVKVSAVVENFVHNYAYVSQSTLEKGFGKALTYKAAYVKVASDDDSAIRDSAAKALDQDNVLAVSINNDFRTRVSNMMSSLDYVIILVIVCAGALAFIVLYNLTNINITERIREIATIKVLGFYPNETSSYVFRENIFLTAISSVIGLGLGKLLHAFVMSQIKIDLLFFPSRISLQSCIISIVFTFLFAILVNLVMMRRLDKINMAESLKSIE